MLLDEIIAALFMSVLGVLSIGKTKRSRVVPIDFSHRRRSENQLARVGIHLLSTSPVSAIFLMLVLSISERFT